MQRLIAWLLARYTPFRVLAWDRGRIAGIGYSNVNYGCIPSGVAQMRAQQFEAAMGQARIEPQEQIIEIDEDGKVHGDISGLRPPKPWPLDRRARVR